MSRGSLRLVTAGLALLVAWGDPVGASVFFSEYIEGSSSNKAVEVYNGSGQAVDLSAYSVQIFFNGSSTPGSTIQLDDPVLLDGETYVLAHSGAVDALRNVADQVSGALSFNGNDAVALVANGTLVDVLGEIGVDPGDAWTSGDVSTMDRTLRRSGAISTGDSIGTDAFDPSIQWAVFPIDTFDGLGHHTVIPEPLASTLLSTGIVVVLLIHRRVGSTYHLREAVSMNQRSRSDVGLN